MMEKCSGYKIIRISNLLFIQKSGKSLMDKQEAPSCEVTQYRRGKKCKIYQCHHTSVKLDNSWIGFIN